VLSSQAKAAADGRQQDAERELNELQRQNTQMALAVERATRAKAAAEHEVSAMHIGPVLFAPILLAPTTLAPTTLAPSTLAPVACTNLFRANPSRGNRSRADPFAPTSTYCYCSTRAQTRYANKHCHCQNHPTRNTQTAEGELNEI
jgi:hypothetical protein